MEYHLENIDSVLKNLKSSKEGLTSEEADKRLKKYGPGQLNEAKKTPFLISFLSQLKDPMVLVLLCAAAASAVTSYISNEPFLDVYIILTVVLLNAFFGIIQESKAEAAIAALKKMSASVSHVIRDGQIVSVPSENIVVGDIILISAGDAVPADARLICSSSLKIDESPLTGESVPVEKDADFLQITHFLKSGKKASDKNMPLGDRKNIIYMGSCSVYGSGKAVVTSTGMNTEMGKIAAALSSSEKQQTPLQKKLAKLSKTLTILVILICLFIFTFNVISGKISSFSELLNVFMLSVSLAVAAIPEGLVAVVTVVLSIGVTRMSSKNAIIRRLTAVETLGCTQVICTDKTGTLTQNKMTVQEVVTSDKSTMSETFALCSDVIQNPPNKNFDGDPTECATVHYAESNGFRKYDLEKKMPRINELPFDSDRKMRSTLHRYANGYMQCTVGAPDSVIAQCNFCSYNGKAIKMTDQMRSRIMSENHRMAANALRVVAAAGKKLSHSDGSNTKISETNMIFYGLAGMSDPVRKEVPGAIQKCLHAGIKTVMITGDHVDTAIAIGKKIGIVQDKNQAITGNDIDQMDDETLVKNVTKYTVCARVKPEHKTRIVKAWQSNGYVTAMTGDGVNDAPSLKNADIGIGMGISGTDVTKNVADMILADDNFATISDAVGEGRRIYDNICKAIQFLLSSNLSEVMSIFIATVIGFTILEPIQILWINLITDSLPALALGLESAEPDLMDNPPRNSDKGLLSTGTGFEIILQGTIVSLLTVTAYFIGHYLDFGRWGIGESSKGVTMAFFVMAITEIFHSWNMRSRHNSIFSLKTHNPALFGAIILSILLTSAMVFTKPICELFSLCLLSLSEYIISMLIAFSIVPIVEICKCIRRFINKRRAK